MLAKLVIAASLATVAVPAAAAADDDAASGQVEEYHGTRSSFWGSNRPAVGGAYRYRLLGIGVVLAGLSGLGMMKLVKRANAERAARDAAANAKLNA